MEWLRLMQTAIEVGQENQLSGDDNGWPMKSTHTVCAGEIYANETAVADPQVATIGNETRSNKKLDPVEINWRSREIYETKSTATVTTLDHVVWSNAKLLQSAHY